MPSKWPKDVQFKTIVLKVEDKVCRACGSNLTVHKDRIHCILSLEGPLKLVCKLSRCSNKQCIEGNTLISPKTELCITMPRWRIGWDLFLWMGFRRFKRHWSVPQIQNELLDGYKIDVSKNMLIDYLRKYQVMVAARHLDLARWQEEYRDCPDLILTIDGLQPEKGHETIYVVRELCKERIWFAESVISSSTDEIQKLIRRAKDLVQRLNKPVRGWVSDKQDAFVSTIATEFPKVPHRYCDNHFLRDLAKPVLELDSQAKVKMRSKVRGLRTIEKETLSELDQYSSEGNKLTFEQQKFAANIIFDYCAAIRGILNDNHGGPLKPSGLRMAIALEEVSQSLERNLKQERTPISSKLRRLNDCIKRGLSIYYKEKSKIMEYTEEIKKIFDTLDSQKGLLEKRSSKFEELKGQLTDVSDPIKTHMSTIMHNFEAGLFVGSDELEIPGDNLDLERWFKKPKGHERRIHGHKHAGMRIVHEGPTLLPALDAHLSREKPFIYLELLPYVEVKIPESQANSIKRNRIMKKASSKKKDQIY